MKKYRVILTLFVLFIVANMVIFPKLYIQQTLAGLNAWAVNVLPSVLPFIFFTKVLSSLGVVERWSRGFSEPIYRCFKTPPVSGYVFLMSVLSGYPVGAKMTADLYQSGKISRQEAMRMTSFCSTSGPMFIIGAVGTMMLASPRIGYMIFLAHAIGAFLNGFLYRKVKAEELPLSAAPRSDKSDLSSMVVDSALSIISVGAIIAIFFVVITALTPILSLLPAPLSGFCAGLIEITRGCLDLSALPINLAAILCTFVISFGGISTILQSLTMLDKIKMPVWLFVLQKLTHAVLSTLIVCLLLAIF